MYIYFEICNNLCKWPNRAWPALCHSLFQKANVNSLTNVLESSSIESKIAATRPLLGIWHVVGQVLKKVNVILRLQKRMLSDWVKIKSTISSREERKMHKVNVHRNHVMMPCCASVCIYVGASFYFSQVRGATTRVTETEFSLGPKPELMFILLTE